MTATYAGSPTSDIVAKQYTAWMYPEPIVDLPTWLQNNWQWFDPSHSSRLFWPNQQPRDDLDILIAGCGTNQAAVIAYNNPGSRVVAVDVSRQSFEHEQFLKERYALKNLELHLLPIEEVGSLNRDFDLIMSTGVLHHMASPETGMQALARCLRRDGVAAIMLYAKFGRLGVDMMQEVFREMGLAQDENSLKIVKDALAALPADHPLTSYTKLAPDLGYDAGLVDTFLHGRERNYTVQQCLELVASGGLVFQDLLFKGHYHPPLNSRDPFLSVVSNLPKERQWAVMERINFRNGCHFFTACRADRDPASYQIDFGTAAAAQYIPSLRYRCRLEGDQFFWPTSSVTLSAGQASMLRLVDGQRSIDDIAREVTRQGLFLASTFEENRSKVLEAFKGFWHRDQVLILLP
jgi:SAM-dependent methyltransferase